TGDNTVAEAPDQELTGSPPTGIAGGQLRVGGDTEHRHPPPHADTEPHPDSGGGRREAHKGVEPGAHHPADADRGGTRNRDRTFERGVGRNARGRHPCAAGTAVCDAPQMNSASRAGVSPSFRQRCRVPFCTTASPGRRGTSAPSSSSSTMVPSSTTSKSMVSVVCIPGSVASMYR